MVGHLLDSAGRHAAAAKHALEEWTNVGTPVGTAERHNQNGVEPASVSACSIRCVPHGRQKRGYMCQYLLARWTSRPAASRAASRNAYPSPPGSASPRPTMSKAVPCAGVVKTVFKPAVTVTPLLNPSSLVAI